MTGITGHSLKEKKWPNNMMFTSCRKSKDYELLGYKRRFITNDELIRRLRKDPLSEQSRLSCKRRDAIYLARRSKLRREG